MALLSCPDCGGEVSSLAKDCPSCGRPVASFEVNKGVAEVDPSAKIALFSLGFGVVAVGLVAYYVDPNIPWWGYLLLWAVSAGGMFKGLLRDSANAKLTDS